MSEALAATSTLQGSSGVRELEWRLNLAAAPAFPSRQDQLDWVEMLADEGAFGEAQLLLRSLAIQSGMVGDLPASLAQLHLHVGLGAGPARGEGSPPRHRNTIEIAMADLRELARSVGAGIAERAAKGPTRADFGPGLHPTAALARAAARPGRRAIAATMEELQRWFSAPLEDDGAAVHGLIDSLRTEATVPALLPAAFAAAARPLLAEALALTGLRGFLQEVADLLYKPLGSPRLLHASAHLHRAGLGPYFRNVGALVRSSRDVFELGHLAAEASAPAGGDAAVEAWVALLSRGLEGGALEAVVDDLGDREAGFALQVILDRTLQRPADEIDQALVLRLRDTALDMLDYPLAARAQRAIVDLRPLDIAELAILGDIDASGGRYRAAEDSLVACLAKMPEDDDVRARLDAARSRRYGPFVVDRGYGSPLDRQLHRLRRRREAARPAGGSGA